MNFESVVKRRRMCREYLDRDVPQEKVNRILDLASRYPSAGHTEPQELLVVRDQRVKEELAQAALDQMFVAQAPLVIVVVSDVRRSAQRYGERGVHFFSITDGTFVEMLVLLAVVDEGLGACFVGSFCDEEVKEAVGEATREVSSEEVSTEMPDGKPSLREKNSRAAATGRFPSAATPSLKRGGKSWVCSATHDLVIGTVSIHSAATLARGAPE